MPKTKVLTTLSMEKLKDCCGEGYSKQNADLHVNSDVTEAPLRGVSDPDPGHLLTSTTIVFQNFLLALD